MTKQSDHQNAGSAVPSVPAEGPGRELPDADLEQVAAGKIDLSADRVRIGLRLKGGGGNGGVGSRR